MKNTSRKSLICWNMTQWHHFNSMMMSQNDVLPACGGRVAVRFIPFPHVRVQRKSRSHTGQCKRTGGCYNELVVAFLRTGGGLKGKKIYTCWLYDLFISLRLFYLWWHLPHRLTVTMQFMALSSNWWFNSWFGLQIQHSSGVLPWKVLFSSKTA